MARIGNYDAGKREFVEKCAAILACETTNVENAGSNWKLLTHPALMEAAIHG